jgi:hypothetical protein
MIIEIVSWRGGYGNQASVRPTLELLEWFKIEYDLAKKITLGEAV